MPNVKVVDMKGNEVGTMELDESVFGAEINTATLHAVVKAYLANQRQGTQSTLTRSEVSGGGKKPWRQKGTGRARQGSTRSPQWTHGGIALGPKPRSYRMSVNKKVKTSAMLSALSAKVASNELIVVDTIALENYSTKTIAEMLKAFGVTKTLTKKYWPAPNAEEKVSHEVTVPDTALIVLDNTDEKVIGSCANIETVSTAFCGNVNVYEILANSKLIMTKAAVEALTERLKEVNA